MKISEMCFYIETAFLEDGLSAHLSCWWLASLSFPTKPSCQSPSIYGWKKSYKYITEKFMYHFYYIAYRKKKQKYLGSGIFSFFFFNINHLIVFFSGRSNRPVEIINVFVICEQFGVSIFSVFLSSRRLQSDKHVSLWINFFSSFFLCITEKRLCSTQQKCILDHFGVDVTQVSPELRSQKQHRQRWCVHDVV